MMKWGMEIPPPLYRSNSNYLLQEIKNTKWTHEENKLFENALAVHDKDTPDRWQKVAAMIPGKTITDVMNQYKELENDVCNIEAGLIPIPGYTTSSFTLDWVNNQEFSQSFDVGGKRSRGLSDQERKKGIPWTEDEHRLFLMGLKKYGKGDWRNISRNFVVSRTPTQVASHAQKYFIRQLSGGKDKKRSSIHDITTVNLTDTTRSPSPDNNGSLSLDQSNVLPRQPNPSNTRETLFDWNRPHEGVNMVFNAIHGNPFVPPSYGVNLYGQNLHRNGTVFQMQSSHCNPHV